MDLEFDLAQRQGSLKGKNQGISIILNNRGKIIRRGVGLPIWEGLVKELKSKNQK